jgi:hypothetical protein
MSDHDPSGRVVAFGAIVRLAIEEANDDSGWSYRSGIDRSDVEKEVRGVDTPTPSTRTIDRALKDAATLGWLEDRRQGWKPGERAESYEQSEETETPI